MDLGAYWANLSKLVILQGPEVPHQSMPLDIKASLHSEQD